MNERQYRCLWSNRQARAALRLDELRSGGRARRTPVGAVVARAAESRRRCAAAEQAWQRVAPPAWLARTRVDGVVGDAVIVVVDSAALHYELRRQGSTLQRGMAKLVPGLCRVRFIVAGRPAAESAAEA